jgi:antagonist of KipI
VISFGVVRGAIQVPPDGNPVLLGPDHQTTGGYPLAGVVCEADWPLAAQLCPGAQLTFREISISEARFTLVRVMQDFERTIGAL